MNDDLEFDSYEDAARIIYDVIEEEVAPKQLHPFNTTEIDRPKTSIVLSNKKTWTMINNFMSKAEITPEVTKRVNEEIQAFGQEFLINISRDITRYIYTKWSDYQTIIEALVPQYQCSPLLVWFLIHQIKDKVNKSYNVVDEVISITRLIDRNIEKLSAVLQDATVIDDNVRKTTKELRENIKLKFQITTSTALLDIEKAVQHKEKLELLKMALEKAKPEEISKILPQ